jgi:hypothetical protein
VVNTDQIGGKLSKINQKWSKLVRHDQCTMCQNLVENLSKLFDNWSKIVEKCLKIDQTWSKLVEIDKMWVHKCFGNGLQIGQNLMNDRNSLVIGQKL